MDAPEAAGSVGVWGGQDECASSGASCGCAVVGLARLLRLVPCDALPLLHSWCAAQLSGLSFGSYLRERILGPAGLNATHLDIVTGNSGVIPDYYPLGSFGYRQVLSPVSPGGPHGAGRGGAHECTPLPRSCCWALAYKPACLHVAELA